MLYNVRKKSYPDGTCQYMWHEIKDDVGYSIPPKEDDEEGEKEEHTPDKERSQKNSRKRAVQAVYDICRANVWTWFLTLTFDPEKVNSFDYEECVKAIVLFTRKLRDRGIQYVIVPEFHKSGRWHFHGLLYDSTGCLPVSPAYDKRGRNIIDGNGRTVYNCPIYDYGFSTVTRVGDSSKASGYLCKYISKSLTVPEGKKRYWASRGLERPQVSYLDLPEVMLSRMVLDADYVKSVDTERGTFTLFERRGRAKVDAKVNKIKILFTWREAKAAVLLVFTLS